jgi:hypothetical protein
MVMSTAPTPQNATPQESDLLVPFESQNIPDEYREYYKTKRNNLFSSIQRFSGMWKYYTLLDQIWFREFEVMKPARDPERMFPLLLYFNAHAKIRVSIELAFSGCMAEARSIMRDAIEFVAHAHTMMGDAELQKTWLSKDDDAAALEAFKDAYERNKKKKGIFKGLDELQHSWGQLSEIGSHATISAICERFAVVKSDKHVEFRLSYCGLEERNWALSLFSLLLTCFTMEKTFYGDYQGRLQFDETLIRMRREFEQLKEQLREYMKVHYKIEPPFGIHIPKPVIFSP